MKKNLKHGLLAMLAFVSFATTSCSNDDDNSTPATDNTIVGFASRDPKLSTLVTALKKTGLDVELKKIGQFTVFAPNNEAFTTYGLTSTAIEAMTTPTEIAGLRNILLNHVIASEIKSADIPASTYVNTLSPIDLSEGAPTISMFVQKSGSTVTVNGGSGIGSKGAVVTEADVDASNGVIHIVDRVIQIPTLVDHVVINPDFDELQAVVTSGIGGEYGDQSGVLNALIETTSATLFAPNNAAFESLGSELPALPSPDQISSVLKYHVVTGNVRSNALPGIVESTTPFVPTLNTQNITFSLNEGNYKITGFDPARPASTIIQPIDIQGSNGVIHTIDKVLLPSLQ